MKTTAKFSTTIVFLSLTALGLSFVGCGGKKPATGPEDATAGRKPGTPVRPVESPPQPWETYHGSSALDGWTSEHFPERLAERWKYLAEAGIENPPVAADGRICFADRKGKIYAVDARGQKLWSRSFVMPGTGTQPARPVAFDAPLALFENTLIACAAGGAIYGLDAATGETRWEASVPGTIQGSPNFAVVNTSGGPKKRLFVIDQSVGVLHAFDFSTGQPVWESEGVGRCDGSPSVNSRFAVFGSCAAALHVFSTETGKMLREIPIDGDSQVAGGVVLLDDFIFSGSRSGKFVLAKTQSDTALWTNSDCENEAFSTPAVHEDRVVYTANDGNLYTLDRATGKLKWKVSLGGSPSSPVIAGDKVFVASSGKLHSLRLADGHPVWSYEVSDETTSPSIFGDLVLVGGDNGALVAFGADAGA